MAGDLILTATKLLNWFILRDVVILYLIVFLRFLDRFHCHGRRTEVAPPDPFEKCTRQQCWFCDLGERKSGQMAPGYCAKETMHRSRHLGVIFIKANF